MICSVGMRVVVLILLLGPSAALPNLGRPLEAFDAPPLALAGQGLGLSTSETVACSSLGEGACQNIVPKWHLEAELRTRARYGL